MRCYLERIQGLHTGAHDEHAMRQTSSLLDLCSPCYLQKAVKDKGLESLLEQARSENPLKEPPASPPLDGSLS